MIPAPFEYERAASLEAALAALQASGGQAKLLAGCHSLIPLMKLRLSEPTRLIDISRLPELAGIREVEGRLEVGAGVVHRDVAESALLRERCPMLAETAEEIGDPQVRNRGTLGGSLAHADPAADYPAAVLALDAELHLLGPRGWRTVPAGEFFQGLFTVDMAPDEILVRIRFAPVRTAAYAKLHQRASHFAIVGVAAALDVRDGLVRAARVALTGATSYARRLTAVERALVGRPPTPAAIEEAAAHADDGLEDVTSDLHASAEYRRAMIRVFARRALERASARASGA